MKRIDIVGGGPAGLYAALLLRQRQPQLQVRVHERRASTDQSGLGIILYGETLSDFLERDACLGERVLAQARPIDCIAVRHQQCWTRMPERNLYSIARQTLIETLIERCISAGVEFRWKSAVHSLSALTDTDLVIIANGARSNLRDTAAAHFGVEKAAYQNPYLWMFVECAFDSFVFDFQACSALSGASPNASSEPLSGEIAVLHGYPFTAKQSSVIVELPAAAAQQLMLRHRAQRQAIAAALSTLFEKTLRGWPLRFAEENATLTLEHFTTVRCADWILPAQPGHPPAVLMGDAARTAHFSIGSGTRLALGDAAALADVFPDLPAYMRRRADVSQRVQRKAQLSMDWFSAVAQHVHLNATQFTQSLLSRAEAGLAPAHAARSQTRAREATIQV